MGWFIRENLLKMDDLGVPLFLETPILTHTSFCRKSFQEAKPLIPCPVLGEHGQPLPMLVVMLGFGQVQQWLRGVRKEVLL